MAAMRASPAQGVALSCALTCPLTCPRCRADFTAHEWRKPYARFTAEHGMSTESALALYFAGRHAQLHDSADLRQAS